MSKKMQETAKVKVWRWHVTGEEQQQRQIHPLQERTSEVVRPGKRPSMAFRLDLTTGDLTSRGGGLEH